jgi:hypothetical protein
MFHLLYKASRAVLSASSIYAGRLDIRCRVPGLNTLVEAEILISVSAVAIFRDML